MDYYIVSQDASIYPIIGPIKVSNDGIVYMNINGDHHILGEYTSKENALRIIQNIIDNFTLGLHFYHMPFEDVQTTEKTED